MSKEKDKKKKKSKVGFQFHALQDRIKFLSETILHLSEEVKELRNENESLKLEIFGREERYKNLVNELNAASKPKPWYKRIFG